MAIVTKSLVRCLHRRWRYPATMDFDLGESEARLKLSRRNTTAQVSLIILISMCAVAVRANQDTQYSGRSVQQFVVNLAVITNSGGGGINRCKRLPLPPLETDIKGAKWGTGVLKTRT